MDRELGDQSGEVKPHPLYIFPSSLTSPSPTLNHNSILHFSNHQDVYESYLFHLPYVPLHIPLPNVLIIADKATWWGCGSHIPAVLDSVPESERCTCTPKVERDGKEYPPKGSN